MGYDDSKKVCIVKYQESVIIRGIEKKLSEKYKVSSYEVTELAGLRREYNKADLFIVYLPGGSGSVDSDYVKSLSRILTEVSSVDKKAMVIGDEDDKTPIHEAVPSMLAHTWISRPLDVNAFLNEIKEELQDDIFAVVEKHILIIDDDPVYAKTVRGWLKDEYRVDIVTAGMQAITFLTRKKVDMILLDYEMPITDGPQVLEMIRQEPNLADIPTIFLTGVDSMQAVSRAAHLKPEGYILKSTSKGDLMMYIKMVFKKLQDKKAKTE